MKKEHFLVVVIALFILSSVLDFLAGPLRLVIKNPFNFLNPTVISTYPFTAVSIGMKTIVIFISILLALSFIQNKYIIKGIFLLFLTALLELYSIQQITTGSRKVILEWTIGLAFGGLTLLLPAVIYLIVGIIKLVHQRLKKVTDPYNQETLEEE